MAYVIDTRVVYPTLETDFVASHPAVDTTTVSTGSLKSDRILATQIIPRAVNIVRVLLSIESVAGATEANPAIIRIYKQGNEAESRNIEVYQASTSPQVVDLDPVLTITVESDESYALIVVDAWDPDTGTPNNTNSIKGKVSLEGYYLTS